MSPSISITCNGIDFELEAAPGPNAGEITISFSKPPSMVNEEYIIDKNGNSPFETPVISNGEEDCKYRFQPAAGSDWKDVTSPGDLSVIAICDS
ncbi:MAG: hypothetical protein ACPG31_06565 [Planctomycetota bacterium]